MKILTRITAAVLSCGMLLTNVPVSAVDWNRAESYNYETSGSCGDAVTWNFDAESGLLSISGTGDMKDYTASDITPWWDFSYDITAIEIADGVTHIGDLGFYGCDAAVSISIPDSVTSIGKRAFDSCDMLETLHIPDGVTEIGYAAFAASGLTELTVPAGVTEIGEQWFYGCDQLVTVHIPDTVTSIADGAFGWSSIKYITIPESVTEIGQSAFFLCAELTKAEIHAKKIGEGAFMYCVSLTDLTLDGVEHIGVMAFASCAELETITVPESVTRIDGGAFVSCGALSAVTVLNPDCEFNEEDIPEDYDGSITICNDANEVEPDVYEPYYNGVIIGYPGSTAQTYAETFGYTFWDVDGVFDPSQLGDVNNDGAVNADDAAEILMEAARLGAGEGTFTEAQEWAGDVNKDGEINSDDAAVVLMYAAAAGAGEDDLHLEDFI